MEIRMVEWNTVGDSHTLAYGYCSLDDFYMSDEKHALWIAAGELREREREF